MKQDLILMLRAIIFIALINTGCKKNKAPEIPSTPSGPSTGAVSVEYTFNSSAEDPDEDSIAIRFDWGDGDTSNWSSWKASGDSISLFHTWTDSGSYSIKAQAKDKKDVISDWSAGHQIAIVIAWTKTYGGSSEDHGYSVQQTSDGGYIITGYTASYGAGYYDVYLVKTDENGNLQWFKTFSDRNYDIGRSIQSTSDGGYIIVGYTGSYTGPVTGFDVYLIKTDGNGNLQWYNTFGGTGGDLGYSIRQTSDGGYIIAGETNSFGAGASDVYLIKTDGNGNQQWYQTYGGIDDDCAYSVQLTSDGGYIIVGVTDSYGGEDEIYLIKVDDSGNQQWFKTFSGFYESNSVQQTLDGGYIIAGNKDSDICLIKTDASGNEQWTKTFGGSDYDYSKSVQQASDGGYIITGTTGSYGEGYGDVYLIKTDANGNQQWYKTFGGAEGDYGYSVQLTSDGGYIITGYSYSFGPNAGDSDVYLIKTDANGNVK